MKTGKSILKINILAVVAILLLLISSCQDPNEELVIETVDTTATVIYSGSFVSNGHPTSGSVKITERDGVRTLVFENFSTTTGPELKVYIANDRNNNSFYDLGPLTALSGTFNYPVDKEINLKEYKFVLIWCKKYQVLIGNAELKE
jgi:hypothetical protein